MSNSLRIKIVLVAGIVVVVASSSWTQVQFQANWQVTLAAASEDASKAGIKTYRIQKPTSDGTVTVELLDASQTSVGTVVERRTPNGAVSFGSISFAGRSLEVQYSSGSVRIVGDGNVLYDGPVIEQSSQWVAEFTDRFGLLTRLMGTVTRDVRAILKRMQDSLTQAQRVSTVPAVFRPIAAAALEILSGEKVHAAARLGDGPLCSYPGGDHRYCELNFDFQRSVACEDAKQESNLDCWNSACIGCCAWDTPDCDCFCVAGDFFCECEACGYACLRVE